MLLLGLSAALTLGLAPAEAHGPAEAIELRWTAPVGCPQRDEARALVEQLVPGAGTGLRADATIEAATGGFAGAIALHHVEAGGVRRLRAEDCRVLARAMAVVIAVSMDPVGVAEAERAIVVPEPEPRRAELERARAQGDRDRADGPPRERDRALGEPGPGDAGDRPLAEPSPPRGRLEGGLRIGAGVGGLLLPAPGVGLVLAPFIGTARFHVRAVAQYWAPQQIALAPPRDARGELQLVTGGLRACPQLAWRRVRIPLCAGIDVGAMLGQGTGRDLRTPRTAQEPWVGAVLEPGVTVGVTSRVSLWLALEGVVSLYRPLFAVEGAPADVPAAWTAGEGAVRGLFGVEIHARRKRQQNP